ncbi:MAG: hypothetical protein M1343_02315 [Chloroflexi bacterium]|nr:hypothetical protein [Chloroflexota bacterium]MDA8188416.1 hypothetical protein [Dehalococcoidales bacterium]
MPKFTLVNLGVPVDPFVESLLAGACVAGDVACFVGAGALAAGVAVGATGAAELQAETTSRATITASAG